MLTRQELFELYIEKPDEDIFDVAKEKWDHISKPIDGLGDFETLVCRIAAICGDINPEIEKRALVVLCSDNGIVDEKISQSDQSVTKAVAVALGKGISSACTMGRYAGVAVIPVDVGICDEEPLEGVLNMKVSEGTNNFTREPAMNETQLLHAIFNGMEIVRKLSGEGYKIIATGEMGIGNTTTSAAVLSSLLLVDSDKLTGRGAGLDDAGLERKKEVIKNALRRYDLSGFDNEKERAFETCRIFGGYDIAGLAGMFIGGALYHIPVVIDGQISCAAAVVAEKIAPGVRDYMIPSHSGREKGIEIALGFLRLKPYINGNMALGEGTGALMLFPLLDMVMDYYKNGAGFTDYEIEEYRRLS